MKTRVDLLLFKKGMASSRTEAQALILAGQVYSNEKRIEKSGETLDEEGPLEVRERLPFVSRGGVKLAHALNEFSIPVLGMTCLDVGASTGGFTDCLLQQGARKIYAVDVGYGQFHWTLRQDLRIVILERTNFRYISGDKIPEPIDLAVADVSFISLAKILPKIKVFLKGNGQAVVLVKPQFELTPSEVKKGVVRSEALQEKAVLKIEMEAKRLGFKILGHTKSPILGPKGNQEYFVHAG